MNILMDLRTGEPVVDYTGKIVPTNITRSFNQYMDVMLRTPIGGEGRLPTWGCPIEQIFKLSYNNNWVNSVKSMILTMVNPQTEPLISEVRQLDVKRDGTSVAITLHVASKYGTENVAEVVANV